MTNGQLTDATILVIAGIIGLFVIAGIVLGVFIQIKKLRTDALAEKEKAVGEARSEAVKETKSELALKALTESVNSMKLLLDEMKLDMKERLKAVECTKTDHTERLARVEAIADSAHKRLDEHRTIDHGIKEDERG